MVLVLVLLVLVLVLVLLLLVASSQDLARGGAARGPRLAPRRAGVCRVYEGILR